jgi:pimeloyl-ACP methyl ester carboxylesterase
VLAGFAGAQTGFDAQTLEDWREVVSGFTQNASLMESLRAKAAAANVALKNVTVSENRSTVKWDMCQTYYQGKDVAKCVDIASRIVSNSSVPSPVLMFGNSSKPPMVFIHGWPQTPAIWVNQFEHFCDGEDASYYCVALSWMNFEPDLPWVSNKTLLTWQGQRNRWHETMTQLGLSNITLVLYEWAAQVGYQGAYEWADMLHALIAMTSTPGALMSSFPVNYSASLKGAESMSMSEKLATKLPYQQVNILTSNGIGSPANHSLLQDMFRAFSSGDYRAFSPLVSMQPRIGWMYEALISQDVRGEGFTTFADWFDNKVEQGWKFQLAPDLPKDVPVLYLYGECARATGCPLCTESQECVKSEQDQGWLQAVKNHTPDSRTASIQSAELPMLDQVNDTNTKIEDFLEGIARSTESKSNILV